MRNPKLGEVFKPGHQQRDAPNINVMRFRCDEPKAKLRHVFFMRQELAFSWRMRDSEGCCGRHGLAEKFPQICHASVRLGSGIGRERVRWRAHHSAVHLDQNGGHGATAPLPTLRF
jgi:hypothetical protein